MIRLAVQKGGRLSDGTLELMKSAGFELDQAPHRLSVACRNFPLEVLAVRDDDIPRYVESGVAALGVVGENVLQESGARVHIIERLGFARCKLQLLAPKERNLHSVQALAGLTIATTYPRLLKHYLAAEGVSAKVAEVAGSIELTPALGLADAVCDLVSTGITARAHGLEPIVTVLESEAVLIGCKQGRNQDADAQMDELLLRLRSSLFARGKRYVVMNAPRAALQEIKALLPSMKSPTVTPLLDENLVAIHTVVSEQTFWEVIAAVRSCGATDIVVFPLQRVLP